MSMSRRSLLLLSATLPLGALASRWALAETASTSKDVLVCVFLRGGVDGLSLVVPHADRAYYAERPGLAIARPGKAEESAIDLDGRFGLHPRLAPLAAAWNAGELAIVHAVGSPHSTRSHFEAQDYMETAVVGKRANNGWLGRALSTRPAAERQPLGTVALSNRTPLALRGLPSALSTPELARFALRAPKGHRQTLARGFRELYAGGKSPVERAGRDALDVADRLAKLDLDRSASKYPGAAKPLSEIAALVKADVGLSVAWIDVGGWDTHTGQTPRLARQLEGLGQGLDAFRRDLGERMERVVVVVMSEFGRTVRENGTGGTDHGHGGVMFLLGGPVNGKKVLGHWPGLEPDARHEGRDLAVTTDFRDVLAEIAEKRLGVAAQRAISDYPAGPRLGVLR
jgi:uncharacterized protein (DUF1501 family)